VHTVNSRWIVHEGLDVTTRRYLEELEQKAPPDRMRRACALACGMAKARASGEDPRRKSGSSDCRWRSPHCFKTITTNGKKAAPSIVRPFCGSYDRIDAGTGRF